MRRLRWLFASPARLYGAMAGAAALMAVFMIVVIGVRVSAPPEAPRSAEVVEEARTVESAAMEAVPGAVRASIVARDGLIQVVNVRAADGRLAEVVLLQDGRSWVVDSVSWR